MGVKAGGVGEGGREMNCIGQSQHPQRILLTPSVRPLPGVPSTPLPHARLLTNEHTARGLEHKQDYFITFYLFINIFIAH